LSSVLGLLLAKVAPVFMAQILTNDEMVRWGWRVPLIVSSLTVIAAVAVLVILHESPVFQAQAGADFFKAFVHFPIEIALVAGVAGLWFTGIWFVGDWVPIYLNDFTLQPILYSFSIEVTAQVLLCVSLPLAGFLSDWKGRVDIMFLGALLLWVTIIPLFFLYTTGKPALVLLSDLCLFFMLALVGAPFFSWTSESFPPRLRCTAVGVGMNFSLAIFGGTAPAVASALLLETQWDSAPSFFLTAMAVGAGVCLIFTKRLAPVPKYVDPDPAP